VTGAVPDVRPYLWSSAVAVAPLRIARGLQNKVLEAVAAGLPVVTTSVVAEGLPPEVLPACNIADDPASFAREIVELLKIQPAARRALAESAQLAPLSWDARLGAIYRILADAVHERVACPTPHPNVRHA
jgi:glycosyltransferase involved in cell wall biosynthesis